METLLYLLEKLVWILLFFSASCETIEDLENQFKHAAVVNAKG